MYTAHFKTALLCLCCLVCTTVATAQTHDTNPSKQPIATVGGQAIYEEDLLSSVQAQLLPLRRQEYEIKRQALDNLIQKRLLDSVANKKGVSAEKLLQQEVDSKVTDPTDAEVEGYYLGQKDRLNRPLAEVKEQLRQSLKQVKIQEARQNYMTSLRAQAEVVVTLSPPRVHVTFDPKRVRGNAKAPVMIVEFSDYQCPYCRQVEPTLKVLLAKYGDKLSLAYRDFPLTIHPQARMAAEASRCAGEQGKFWEYHDQLLAASDLERPALIDYAKSLKLDDKRFDSCLTEGTYRLDIEKDQQEGTQAGVSGTPGFFVNGIPLSGAQPPAAFIRAIEDELAHNGGPAK